MGDCSNNWPDDWDKLTIIGQNREKDGRNEDVDATLLPRINNHVQNFLDKNHRLRIIFNSGKNSKFIKQTSVSMILNKYNNIKF